MTGDDGGRSGSQRIHYRYKRAEAERDRARNRAVWLDGVVAEAVRLLEAGDVAGALRVLKGGDA